MGHSLRHSQLGRRRACLERSDGRSLFHRVSAYRGTAFLALWVMIALSSDGARGGEPGTLTEDEFFERRIRPVLFDRCWSCHGSNKQWASLRLDSRDGLLLGGDGGPVIDAGDWRNSEILARLREEDPGLRMPPAEAGAALSPEIIADFERWVEQGVAWPQGSPAAASGSPLNSKDHWAFQPLVRTVTPGVASSPTDAWVDQGLQAAKLTPNPQADRRTRLRRASYAVRGLPPSLIEIEALDEDFAPDAWERAVDRLLASPAYGERWGRVWLDVARYSDTKGYVYGREERKFVHSNAYRDWVINAFNADMPYDRFLKLQIAADRLVPDDSVDRAAMGFLTLGRRFLAIPSDIIEDRIDTVFRGLMGLTVGCARCHDHKFDPIPTADYYALYGIFQSSIDQRQLFPVNLERQTAEFRDGLEERRKKLHELSTKHREEANARIRTRFEDYLEAQTQLEKYPEGSFNQLSTKEDVIPALVHRWEWFLTLPQTAMDPRMRLWTELSKLPAEGYAERAAAVIQELRASPGACEPSVLRRFESPPQSVRETAERYGQLVEDVASQWKAACDASAQSGAVIPNQLDNPDDERLRRFFVDARSSFYIPDEPIDSTEWYWDNGTCVEIWQAQGEIDRWLLQVADRPPEIGILVDRELLSDARIFRRGDPNQKGRMVPRHFLTALSDEAPVPMQEGSGRLELAEAVSSERNPLTARVWVNRVWQQLFGVGLVASPSDFGLRSDKPSHPELLDQLALEFMEHEWSTRWLVRELLLSDAYQRESSSHGEEGIQAAERSKNDPGNRWLWKMPKHRLTWEELRDMWLATSDQLGQGIGGPSVDALDSNPSALSRRTVYAFVDRQYLPLVFQMFDFANPDMHTPVRSETIVPQQALFQLNHPLVAASCRAISSAVARDATAAAPSDDAFVVGLYQRVYQRSPTPAEVAMAMEFLVTASLQPPEGQTSAGAQLGPREQLAQVLLISNEAIFLE
jgi:hypothetical protein